MSGDSFIIVDLRSTLRISMLFWPFYSATGHISEGWLHSWHQTWIFYSIFSRCVCCVQIRISYVYVLKNIHWSLIWMHLGSWLKTCKTYILFTWFNRVVFIYTSNHIWRKFTLLKSKSILLLEIGYFHDGILLIFGQLGSLIFFDDFDEKFHRFIVTYPAITELHFEWYDINGLDVLRLRNSLLSLSNLSFSGWNFFCRFHQ